MNAHPVRSFAGDEIIFKEGDVGDCAYLIEKGRVLVFVNKEETEVPLKVIGAGEVFGEMSLIDDSLRSASCRAIGDVQLIVVTKEQLLDRIRMADPVVRLLMQVLLERLRSQNDILRGKIPEIAVVGDSLAKEKKEALDRIEFENRIATALNKDEFLPFYQPICDLNTGEVVGCEALVRWMSKDQGMIPPSVFMDVMEESSLILKAGQVMIEKSMADFLQIQAMFGGNPNFFVSVNVSGRQFTDPYFLEHLEASRVRYKLQASHIKLELTERIMMVGPQALAMLQVCRQRGYQLAVDDFGTGFSSLQYLAQMPLTDLKIDRSFVMKMLGEDKKSLAIVKSFIFMANILGLKLIAEGIESPEELGLLRMLGVGMGQGYLFSKPLSLEDLRKYASKAGTASAA